jgi:hypothetical protein
MFLTILAISIITAIGQVMSTNFSLKDETRTGISKITIAGWIFYLCTFVLAFLPAIQEAIQESLQSEKDRDNSLVQDKRDERLRKSYDSAIVDMKKKFDASSNAVTETLGKYGYKLDSANRVLINIKDSLKPHSTESPLIRLITPEEGEPGIVFVRHNPDEGYVFKVTLVSLNASSAGIDLTLDFATQREILGLTNIHYNVNFRAKPLESNSRIGINDAITSYILVHEDHDFAILYMWLHGSYKRFDGSGYFPLDLLYAYYFENKAVRLVSGETRKNILGMIRAKQKMR